MAADRALTGQRFGALVIGPLLGAGGMGHVYRARDTELDRDVAVKVLPPGFAHDDNWRSRFTREARVLASLNHPNIAQIHGLEKSDETTGLVMELVDGVTLAERVARGPIAVAEALPLAGQIVDALEAAHEQGIVHRDLKPANIKVRPNGTVKVLDFGLAKAIHRTADEADDATISAAVATRPGTILGTSAYMAPEQAKGMAADRRADLWAFGCVLFEMLTARRAFRGATNSEVLVNVIEREPDWEALPSRTPPAIRRLLHRCLQKDPKRRLDSAVVARIEIDEAAREPAPVVRLATAAERRAAGWRSTAWAATGAGAALLVMIFATDRGRPSEGPPSLVATSILVEGLNLGAVGVNFAVAPNGRTVVFAASYGGQIVLHRRDLDRVDADPMVGTAGGSDIFFSPDGRRIGFETGSELWTASLDGGTPQRLAPNQPLRGGTWGQGDRIVVGRVGSGLWMASPAGGEPRQLTRPAEGERHELPQMLPGGRAVLFTILSSNGPSRAAVHLLETGETRALFEGTGARFVESGHVVFGRQGKLWAAGFDPVALEVRGEARPIRDDVLWSSQGYPQFAVGGDLLAYVRANPEAARLGNTVPMLVDRTGKQKVLPFKADIYKLARFSPAADRVAVLVGSANELWIHDLRRGTSTRLSSDRIIAFSAPVWTPDGTRIVFTTWFNGEVGLGRLPADGSGPVETLVAGMGMRSFERTHPVLLPDGSGVVQTGLAPGASVEDLLFVSLAGEKRLEALWQAPGVESNPAIAPNARFIAYNSDESGVPEVYVRPYPNAGARRWLVSTGGGAGPVWARGGRELLYRDTLGRIMAVAVRSDGNDQVEFSTPEHLFTFGGGSGRGLDRGWDVTADGESFLFHVGETKAAGGSRTAELLLIQNWTTELNRLLPR